ncbi:uncharacterized protein LJ264_013968 [Porphyrio hochstetteri]
MAGLAQCQREAAEVAQLMTRNLERALERDGRLSQLDTRAQELRSMGQAFTRTTRVLARQQRRGHRLWRLAALGLATLLLLLLLALGLALWLPRAPPAAVTVAVTGPQGPAGTEPQALPPTGLWGDFGATLQ